MKATTAARLASLAIGALMLFGAIPASAASPPSIESESATDVTEHNAVLHATINPNGTLTQYKLQFDESGTYHFYQPDCGVLHVPGLAYCQHVTPGDERIEPPEGSIPAGSDAVEVSVDLASIGATIEPNTTYHYRAIAANGAPEVEGPDQTFTTPPVGASPPSIISESATNVTAHDATLSAQINPNGLDTTYQFRLAYGCPLFGNEVCPQYCPVPPGTCGGRFEVSLPSGEIPASSESQTVSLDLNAVGVTLDPAERYGYTVEATNSAGPPVKGPGQTFTTPPAGQAPEAPVTEPCSGPISGSGVRFCGTLNPGSSAKVGYYFEVGEGSSCVGGTHFGDLAEVEGQNVPVSTQVHSLAPYTEYTVCLVATNSAGETRGQGLVFMTSGPPPSAAEPPTIEGEAASNITSTGVTLEATIDPQEAANGVFYQFQLLHDPGEAPTEIACPSSVPGYSACVGPQGSGALPIGWISGSAPQTVSLDLSSAGVTLTPGHTYYFRVLAADRVFSEDTVEWEAPTVYGVDQAFTTPPPAPTPPSLPPLGSTAPASLPGANPAPFVSHPRRAKHKRRHHRRHNGSARSTRTVRR